MCVTLLLNCAVLFAASMDGEASLRVVVLDSNGAAIASSRVQVKIGDEHAQTLDTDQRGEAIFTNLMPGKIQIHVEAAGFAPRDIGDAPLKPGGNQLEVRLEVAEVKEEVVVKQDRREQQTDPRGDAFATILTEEQIANLPDDPDEMEATLKRMAGPGAVIRVNGFRGGRLPPKSQIRQIRFRRDSYAAEYHEAGFTGVDIITKPGMDSLHGSLSFAFRDEALNARNAFAPERGAEQLRRFGLTLDAPLLHNRTSLFLAAEGNQSFDSQTIFAALPDDGDFADTVRRPSRNLYTSARIVHALTKAHTLSLGYERNAVRNDNLGVGNFDLRERAYSLNQAENVLRVADAGTLGKRLFNEFRFQMRCQAAHLRSVNETPALIVLNAFNRGGAQQQSDNRAREFEIADNLDFAFRQHALRAGLLIEAGNYRNDSIDNAGGTFTFTSLEDFRAARPSIFSQRVGRNPLSYSQYQAGAYLQDDMRLRPSLTLSFGLRYERQNNLEDSDNFAPRVGFAWSPFKDGRTAIRGGAGIFYEWVEAATFGEIRSVNGEQQLDIVIRTPGFPDPFAGGTRNILPPSRLQSAPLLVNPYIEQASLGIERQLGGGLRLRSTYLYQRGLHLLRGHNINAPMLGGQRPDPTLGNIIQVESTANSTRHLLNLTLNSVLSKRLYWLVDYSLSKAINEADGVFSLPADNFNLRAERGASLDDSRHRLFATAGLEITKGLRLGTTFYANSALPYNIITGRDDNGDTAFNDRPEGVARNSARGAAQWDLSMRLSWMIGVGERQGAGTSQGPRMITVSSSDVGAAASELAALNKKWRVNFYIQAFNLFNHTNLINFSGVQASPFFGQATAALPGRRVETGLRFSF